MGVFTPVTMEEVQTWISGLDVGEALALTPILQGVENTNYRLETTSGRFILTLFEGRTDLRALPFFFDVMEATQACWITAPQVVKARDGARVRPLAGKPAALLTFLDGRGVEATDITPDLCGQLGAMLARMHTGLSLFPKARPNTIWFPEWRHLARRCAGRAEDVIPGLAAMIDDELAFLQTRVDEFDLLPGGIVHADLFPDNVFIDNRARICGVIDFYFACRAAWLYDFAITFNAWCFDASHALQSDRAAEFLRGYETVRPFTQPERELAQTALRAAAVRFIVSRLHDVLFQPSGAIVQPKDPREYLIKLQTHQISDVMSWLKP